MVGNFGALLCFKNHDSFTYRMNRATWNVIKITWFLMESYPYSKTEYWYIIDYEEGPEFVYGHHANSKKEFKQMVKDGKWEQLLRRIKVP
jgi:hypothetical protein